MKALADRLSRVRQELTKFPEWANVALGNQALAMISKRIITKGEAAEGSFSPYSTNPMLVGATSFRTKSYATAYFGERGPKNKKSKKLEWRTVNTPKGARHLAILPGGYKKLRDLNKAQSGHKSFLWTGEMWGSMHYQPTDKSVNKAAGIKVEGTVQTGEGQYTTIVGSQNILTNKKLEGHFKRKERRF